MNVGIPPEHPDDDLLADLTADVLPSHQARVVEAHVLTCQRCTALLTDAEQVRDLLGTDDPGPMPPEVLAQIDQALQGEAAARTRAGVSAASPAPTPAPGYTLPPQPPATKPPVRVITPWEDTTTIEAFAAARKQQASESQHSRETSDPATTASDTSGIPAARNRDNRPIRPSRGPSRSRRDLREEVRDVKVGRRGTLLAAAAGTVIMLGLGGYVIVGLFGNESTDSTVSAASSVEEAGKSPPPAPGNGPPVLSTGTHYTQDTLEQQARALVDQVSSGATGTRPRLSGANSADQNPVAAASGAATGNESLRTPAVLNGCLSELRAGNRRPVVVDLAKFNGRDAAIIVLNGSNGGYEVWAVGRDCRPGTDGTITYLDLTH